MSWLYSQALVAEYSAANCSGGAPCVPSSASPTPQAYLPSDRMTDYCRPSRFGMTFAPLTASLGADLLTWFLAASRARTSARPAKAPASTAHGPAYGEKWRELSMRFDPDTRLWRTHRCLWNEVLPESSVSLPRWGLMRGGVLSVPVTSAHPTSVSEFGLWPTPRASANENRQTRPTPSQLAGRHGRSLCAAVNLWPTPLASDGTKGGPNQKGGKGDLRLASAVHQFPTPTARDWKSGIFSPEGKAKRDEHSRGKPLNETIGGQLNPTWVEWLMGWPLGWTDLQPLATDKYRNARQRHGGCLQQFEINQTGESGK